MAISYADVFDAVADAVQPQDAAIICDGATLPWSEFAARTNAFARSLIGRGLKPGAKVAQYMRNGPGYPIAFVGAFKARMAPVNVNYRYGPDELHYLFDNSDAEVVVFDAEFADAVRVLKPRLPRVVAWVAAGGNVEGFETLDAFTSGDGSRLGIDRSPVEKARRGHSPGIRTEPGVGDLS